MNNEQKEITLEDVKKMTLDEFRKLPQKQKSAFTPEQRAEIKAKIAREERIKSLDFINNDRFKEFLHNNGYDIVGYDHNTYDFERRYIYFSAFGGYERAYRCTDRGLILLGPQDKWEEYYVDDFTASNIVNNPFVKFIDWDLTEFKVYTIVNNSDAGGWGSDEPIYAARLEKDLSKEWIEFWVLRDQDYVKYILNKCAEVRNETPKSIEHYKNLLAKRIAELQAETEKRINTVEQEATRYNKLEQLIKSIKGDSLKI